MKRLTVWVDCDDKAAEMFKHRIDSYLMSLGAINVHMVAVEDIEPARSRK